MATGQKTRAPRLEEFVGRSERARRKRAWLAERTGTDEDTVLRWVTGSEAMPDPVITWLSERLGCSVAWLMHWDDAPRSEISEGLRQHLAEDVAARTAQHLPGECESVLRWVERRLAAEGDLEVGSPESPRLRQLRTALLEFLAEPLDGTGA